MDLKNKISFSLWMIIIYLILLFVVVPLSSGPKEISVSLSNPAISQRGGGQPEPLHRLPLVIGMAMVVTGFLTKRSLAGMTFPASLFIIFSCFFLISGLWGPYGFWESFRLLFATTAVGLCLVLTIRKPRQIDYFLNAMIAVGLANALYGLLFTIPYIAVLGDRLQSLGLPSGRDLVDWRLIGLLGDPTNCGLLLILGFLIILDRIFDKIQTLNLVFAMIFILAIFLTFSRTTWFGMLAGVIFFMWQKKIPPTKIALLSMIGGLFFLAAHSIFSFSIEQNQFRWNIAQSDTRSGVWLFWLAMAITNPFGYGMGYVMESWNKHLIQAPHNIYLSTWVEGGIQTLIPLLLLLWVCFKRQWHIRKYVDPETGKEYGPLVFSLFVAIAASLLGLSYMMQLLFIAMGLCFSCFLLARDGLLVPQDKTSGES